MEPWTLRPIADNDGPALARLEAEHPDSGPVQLTFHYKVDAWQGQRALRPGCQGVVAEVDGTVVAMGRTPRREPAVPRWLTVSDAVDQDWPTVATLHRQLFSGYELALESGPDDWRLRYSARPFGPPLNRYLVARDPQGRLVAGLGLWFDSQVQEGRFGALPLPLRVLNLVVGLIPPDGVLRRLVVRDVWFDPDHPRGPEAVRALWTQAGWVGRDQGTSRMLFLDGRGPLGRAFTKAGMVPGGGGWLLVSSEAPLDLNRPIALPM